MGSDAERVPVLELERHDDAPLVTVQLMTHEGDIHLLPRAVASVGSQGINLELQIVFDGQPSDRATEIITKTASACHFPVNEYVNEPKVGYYCIPRNRALPHAWGHYIAHMDADNEWAPNHLRGLLRAIRNPQPGCGFPHFVYSRRTYVDDNRPRRVELPLGDSPLVLWGPESRMRLQTPQGNFVDTGDFLIGKGTLYELAERSGFPWNPECRRFGDWDLVARLAKYGFRGFAVDQVSHIYHWHGANLQLTRQVQDVIAIPEAVYDSMVAQGRIKP
jgi:hypothetical protein